MSFTQVPPNSTGNKIDTRTLVDGADTVHRQVVVIGDPTIPGGVLSFNSEMPGQNSAALPVRQAPQKYTDISFSQVGSGLLSPELTQIAAGSGMTVSQSNGNLVVAAGTTANAEFVARSIDTFNGGLTLKEITTLSQRIANNNFYVELVDVIGDGLSYTINSATSVTVTKTAHGFTAQNVGQRMDICAITGAAGVPMEAVIASIPDANNITFTVAGWPASGSGTCSLTGWNKVEVLYTGTTATNASFNTRRKGRQNTAATAAINTTAAAHMGLVNIENGVVSLGDKVITAGATISNRSVWDTNIPQPDVDLYLQIRAKNGTTAPASTTTWTIGMFRVEDYVPVQVSLTSTRQQSLQNSLVVSGTVANSSSSSLIGDVGRQYRANATGAASMAKLIAANTTNPTVVKASAGRLLGWELANTTASWVYVKLHNIATAPTAGSTAVAEVIAIPPNGVNNFTLEGGMGFATGIAFTTVTGSADADATAVAAGAIVGGLFFA